MQAFFATLERTARQQPDRLALSDGVERLGYGQLVERLGAIAAFLERQGLGPGARLGFLRSRLMAGYLVVLACLRAGVNIVYLDTRDNPARTRAILQRAGVALLLSEEAPPEGMVPPGCPTARLPRVLPAAPDWAPPALGPDMPAWMEPTSGSTGTPKLVEVSRETLGHYLALQTELSRLRPDDRVAVLNEMWLDVTLSGLNAGASVHLFDLRRHGAAALADWLRSERITALQTFLAAFRALAEAVAEPLPHLARVKLAGEALTRADVAAFNRICPGNAVLMNFYGATELSLVSQYDYPHGAPLPRDILPVGKPVPGTEIELLGENGAPVPPGQPGRVRVIARHMADGYLDDPERSSGVYAATGDGRRSLTTADLGRFDRSGNLVILGRIDDQVKIRGYSVRLGEVEAALKALPEIAEAAVTTLRTPHDTLQLVAHYVPQPGVAADPADLRARLAESQPAYMVPSHFLAHESLPRTDTGKILRRALPDPHPAAPAGDPLAGASALERRIGEIWASILGHSAFGREDDFFDMGGDSLQAMSMVLKVERAAGMRLGYESLILHGASIAAIAARLSRPPAGALEGMVWLREGEGRPPVHVLPVENGEFSDWLHVLGEMQNDHAFLGVHVRDPARRSGFRRLSASRLGERAAERILARDGQGPFLLAGYSAGTHLAIETARALCRAGGEIGGLLLVDPPVPWLEPYYRGWRLRRILGPLVKRLDLALALNRAGHILFGLPARELDVADETVFWNYRPEPFACSRTLIVSTSEENPHLQEKLGFWRGIFGEEVPGEMLSANHQHVMRGVNAAHMAGVIDAWLGECVLR